MKCGKTLSVAVRGAHNSPIRAVCRLSNANAQHNIIPRRRLHIIPSTSARFLPLISPVQWTSSGSRSQSRKSSDDASLKDDSLNQTALHELHVNNGGKMVPFGGYSMPVQYTDLSVGESHKWTREKASLFDVGHMYTSRYPPPIVTMALIMRVQGTAPTLRSRHCFVPRKHHTYLRGLPSDLPLYSVMPPSPCNRWYSG